MNEGRQREIELENGKNGGKGKRLGSGRKRYFLLEYFFFFLKFDHQLTCRVVID